MVILTKAAHVAGIFNENWPDPPVFSGVHSPCHGALLVIVPPPRVMPLVAPASPVGAVRNIASARLNE